MSSTNITELLDELRLLARRRPEVSAGDQSKQLVLYAERLARMDPRDSRSALARRWKFWPDWNELLEAVEEEKLAREHRQATQFRGSRRGENFVQRCQRLGFAADRLSAIGHGAWRNIWERSEPDKQYPPRWMPMPDEQIVQALQWCEEHPGVTWATAKPPATANDIRATAKMVFDIEATPESFIAGKALAKIGRELIRRHMEAGTCPPDVATFFPQAEPPGFDL